MVAPSPWPVAASVTRPAIDPPDDSAKLTPVRIVPAVTATDSVDAIGGTLAHRGFHGVRTRPQAHNRIISGTVRCAGRPEAFERQGGDSYERQRIAGCGIGHGA